MHKISWNCMFSKLIEISCDSVIITEWKFKRQNNKKNELHILTNNNENEPHIKLNEEI
jgi:hypothetical protein